MAFNNDIIGLTISEICLILVFLLLAMFSFHSSQYNEKIDQRESIIEKKAAELEKIKEQIQDYKEEIQASQREIEALNKKVLQDQKEIENYKIEISGLNQRITKLKDQQDFFKSAIDMLRSTKENLSLQNKEHYIRKIAQLDNELAEAKKKLSEYEKKKRLRSAQKPSCIEKDVVNGFLCTIEILSADKFLIDGETYTYNELLEHFQDDLRYAEQNQCVLSVKVEAPKNIMATEYDSGLRKIEREFYVQRLRIN